ncbi:MAG: hypothetical protein WA139_04020 [Candidatus Aenigmatarchaeota archaeon]
MKGMELAINETFVLAITIIVALVVFGLVFMIPTTLGGVNTLKQNQINDATAKQLEDLGAFYDTFKKTDGGFDSYEASVLLAKVIEYTWEDCANFCESKMDIADFTNFFLTHPIVLSKTLDCGTEYVYDKDTEHKISKNRISGYCKAADVGDDKTETADEWTTTIWGLYRNSVMCTNYFADGYQWGNFNCGSAETPNIKCNPLCGKGVDWTREITQDRIKSWEGAMTKGNSYSNIRVLYNPDCTLIAGFFPLSDQACLEVQISAAFDFSLSASPSSGSVLHDGSTSTSVTATLTSGTTQPVSLSCSGLPAGASCSFAPSSVSPTASGITSTLTITASDLTGIYPITISGTGGSATTTFTLTVAS